LNLNEGGPISFSIILGLSFIIFSAVYPSCILEGELSRIEFLSNAISTLSL
jgi:hypothetical protein